MPSSRSVAFLKSAWEAVGGYPEWLDYCEDLVFDLELKRAGRRFAWRPQALVRFRPRQSAGRFFLQYYRYARGDGKADLFRRRHAMRYAAYAALMLLLCRRGPGLVLLPLALAVALYTRRPYARLRPFLNGFSPGEVAYALALVPAIRLVGDIAKMLGYPVGVWWRLRHAEPWTSRSSS